MLRPKHQRSRPIIAFHSTACKAQSTRK